MPALLVMHHATARVHVLVGRLAGSYQITHLGSWSDLRVLMPQDDTGRPERGWWLAAICLPMLLETEASCGS